MNKEKQLEEIAVKLSENTGVSMDEARRTISSAMTAFGQAVKTLSEAFASVFNYLKKNAELIYKWQINQKKKREARKGWVLKINTTKPSQVMINKPKFSVRKVVY